MLSWMARNIIINIGEPHRPIVKLDCNCLIPGKAQAPLALSKDSQSLNAIRC
jgi:hypothetical protein